MRDFVTKLNFTKDEVEYIKSKIYLTKEEEKILDMWLYDKSLLEMSFELCLSTATIIYHLILVYHKIKKATINRLFSTHNALFYYLD